MIITVTLNPSIDRTLEVPGMGVGKLLKGHVRANVAAGKGVNLSNILAILGVQSTVTGFAGRAQMGLFKDMERQTKNLIKCEMAEIRGDTRISTTIIDPKRKGETHIREFGPSIRTEEKKALERKLSRFVRKGDLVVFGGSPAQNFSQRDFGRLLDIAIRKKGRAVIDASAKELKTGLKIGVSAIKPNKYELQDLLGKKLRNMKQIISEGKKLLKHCDKVIVSLGKQGALLLSKELAVFARAPEIKAVNSVGAGDALLAGYLAASSSGKSEEEALRQAVACGSASAAAVRAGWISRRQARELARRVRISRLRY